MKLSTTALIDAIRLHLGTEVATAFAAQASRLEPSGELPATMDDAAVGRLLAAALGLRADSSSVQLHSVQLFPAGGAIVLDAADALDHPLLFDLPKTLDDAIAAPLVAGARAHFLAPSAPTWAVVHLAEAAGALNGSADLRVVTAEGVISACAMWGEMRGDRMVVTTHSVAAAALYEIGRVARAAASLVPPPAGGQGEPLNIVPGTGALN